MSDSTARFAPPRVAWRELAMGAPLVIVLLVLLVYPVGQLLLLSVRANDTFTLAPYRQLFAASVYVQVLGITLKIAFWTTVFAVVAGYPVAFAIAAAPARRKTSLLFWVLLAFWTSFLVRAFAWIVLLGRNGVINQLLLAAGLADQPADLLYNFGAVIVGMVHALMPLAILTMLSVMENIDGGLTRAAATLGAKPGSAFWRIYFPLSFPGVAAAAIMVFVTAIGFFIVPALLGGRRETMIAQIIIEQVLQTLNWGFAGAISVLLLLVVIVVFLVYDRVFGLSTVAGGSGRGDAGMRRDGVLHAAGQAVLAALGLATDWLLALLPRRRRVRETGRSSLSLRVVLVAMLLFLSVPAFLMIPMSFSASPSLTWPPKGFSLQWYRQVFDSPVWVQAMTRSTLVALATATLAMLIATPAAFLIVRSRLRFKAALLAFALSPIVVPRMIIAVGLFYFFARVGLVGTATGLVLGHTVVALPYVVMTMIAVLKNYDTRLDLAAQSLGATPWATLRHVTFPILAAGLLSSFLFAFATSFDELTIALFATGGLNATLPKQFWDEVTLQVSPVIAAVSTTLFLFLALLIWSADRLRRKSVATT